MIVYLDTCIIIYLVEERPGYCPQIEALIQQTSQAILAFSALSELECLVLPFKNQQQVLIDKFRNWFRQARFLELERTLFEDAARLRAAHRGLKTPDAIHLAAAQHHGCQQFWTNDDRLSIIAPNLVKRIT